MDTSFRFGLRLGILYLLTSIIPAFLSLVGAILGIIAWAGQIQYATWLIATCTVTSFLLAITFILKMAFYIHDAEDNAPVPPLMFAILLNIIIGVACIVNHALGILDSLYLVAFCIMIFHDILVGGRIVQDIARARDQRPVEVSTPTSATIQCCAICKKPGIHEVCLDCETKYQAERHKVRAQILRAKRAGVLATLTLPEWIDTLNSLNWKCVYCQTKPYAVMEHFVPITQGGGTTKENCTPSCVSCNSIKGNKHPDRIAPKFKHK